MSKPILAKCDRVTVSINLVNPGNKKKKIRVDKYTIAEGENVGVSYMRLADIRHALDRHCLNVFPDNILLGKIKWFATDIRTDGLEAWIKEEDVEKSVNILTTHIESCMNCMSTFVEVESSLSEGLARFVQKLTEDSPDRPKRKRDTTPDDSCPHKRTKTND
jgi:hypothetical protein